MDYVKDGLNNWFVRGAQSAFFFYVSGGPCANARFNRRRAKEKARAEKAATEAYASQGLGNGMVNNDPEQQRILAGHGAFITNRFWQEEIEAGPTFKRGMRPKQDMDREMRNQKRRRGRSRATSGPPAGRRADAAGASLDTIRTNDDEGDAVRRPLSATAGNRPERYQRPDEMLWGNPFPEKDWSYYARGRNPPVNDYAPPVVSSLPATAEEASWMLQPPPPAKIMEGKDLPVKRTSSIGTASKVTVSKMTKRSGGTRFSELKPPEKVLLADLGDGNICSMTLPKPTERKGLRRIFGSADGTEDPSRPTTPQHTRQDSAFSAFSTFDSPSRNISRVNRPAPILTSMDSDTDAGFDPHFTFPRRTAPQLLDSPPMPMSTVSSNMDGLYYHSEPEPDLAYSHGISFQDFAEARNPPTTADSDAPFQTPKSKATTRAGSNSPSPTTLSPDSSSSSLHVLKDVLAPAVIMDADKTSDAKVGLQLALPHMDGITEEELENVVPRFSSGPREVRLGSGSQV